MRRSSVVLFLVVLATLGAVFPASAGNKRLEGPRVAVTWESEPLPAPGEAFHVRHGFGNDPSFHAPDEIGFGTRTFRLEVTDTSVPGAESSVDVPKGSVVILIDRSQELWKTFQVVYTFSDGLPAGNYEFTGHWYQPCTAGDDYWCDGAGPPSEVLTLSRTITIEGP